MFEEITKRNKFLLEKIKSFSDVSDKIFEEINIDLNGGVLTLETKEKINKSLFQIKSETKDMLASIESASNLVIKKIAPITNQLRPYLTATVGATTNYSGLLMEVILLQYVVPFICLIALLVIFIIVIIIQWYKIKKLRLLDLSDNTN